jgi:sarcosine oxidase
MNKSFDFIVTGIGSMGSATCYFLAKQGYKVLGLEQFDIVHESGSHTGQSRIIRKAYFEHPDYVPLLERAYKNWKDLEKETSSQLYYPTGLVYFGRSDSSIIKGVKKSASLFNIPVEKVDRATVAKRLPQFAIPEDFETLFEPDAGFVTPEKTIKLYVEQAILKGAEVHTREKVIQWTKEGSSISVITDKNSYRCRKLIITAGAWSGQLLPLFSNKLKVTRQLLAWIKPKQPENFLPDKFPCWMIADDEKKGVYYGFPFLSAKEFGEPAGLKLAHHYPALITDPDNVDRRVTAEEMSSLNYLLDKYLPGVDGTRVAEKTCLYANSPDGDFIIDKLPGYEENVIIACGFSGHGFKFVPVVGEILAELALEGKTKQPIGFLSAKRFVDKT